MSEVIATNQTILVVGGGISGMTAALEAAECGKQVILVEKNPSIGGRVSQLYKYFPQALPSQVRAGNQPPSHQGQPQPARHGHDGSQQY